eukprot:8248367-Pyramimonas_sp.AAC.1
MGRPSRSFNFAETPWVWSHGDGPGRRVDPTNHPPGERLTKTDCQPTGEGEGHLVERRWQNLDSNHRLKRCNRESRGEAAETPRAGQ